MVAAFYTTRLTIALVGLALGKVFISRLATWCTAGKSTTTAVKKLHNFHELYYTIDLNHNCTVLHALAVCSL